MQQTLSKPEPLVASGNSQKDVDRPHYRLKFFCKYEEVKRIYDYD